MVTPTNTARVETATRTAEVRKVGRSLFHYVSLALRYAVLGTITTVFLGPFIMAFFGSFKTTAEVLLWPPTLLPNDWRLSNYADVWNVLTDANGNSLFPRWVFNSLLLSTVITAAHLIFCSLAGFAFARLEFPGKNLLFASILSTLMIPAMVLMIPQYQILNSMGLINTYSAIILPGLTSASAIFLLTQFMRSIPKDLDEAAWMDGASIFTTYWRIILPLSKPAMITVALLSFQGVWNAFLAPLILLNTPEMFPLTVGLGFLKGQYGTFYNVVLAGSMFNTVPMVLLFLVFSRFYVQGATYAGVKG